MDNRNYTTTDTSRTPCSVVKMFCNYKGFLCEYATLDGYCKLTACCKPNVLYQGGRITILDGTEKNL